MADTAVMLFASSAAFMAYLYTLANRVAQGSAVGGLPQWRNGRSTSSLGIEDRKGTGVTFRAGLSSFCAQR
jgi:hypothetical protein